MGHCTSDEVIEYFKEQLMGVTQVEKLFAGAKFEINQKKIQKRFFVIICEGLL